MVKSEVLKEMATRQDVDVNLIRSAVEIAKVADPNLEYDSVVAALDSLAEGIPFDIKNTYSENIQALLDGIYGELGFKGNAESYYDPNNSLINKVIETKLGIPITLALLLIEIAARKDIKLKGIGFPGHFLVTASSDPSILIDPFVGCILDEYKRGELIDHAQRDYGQDAETSLKVISNYSFVARMASNLKHIFMLNERYEDALELCNIILLFTPRNAGTWRDRGLVKAKLQHFQGAKGDLEKYLELAPDDRFAPAIRAHVERLEKRISLFH